MILQNGLKRLVRSTQLELATRSKNLTGPLPPTRVPGPGLCPGVRRWRGICSDGKRGQEWLPSRVACTDPLGPIHPSRQSPQVSSDSNGIFNSLTSSLSVKCNLSVAQVFLARLVGTCLPTAGMGQHILMGEKPTSLKHPPLNSRQDFGTSGSSSS